MQISAENIENVLVNMILGENLKIIINSKILKIRKIGMNENVESSIHFLCIHPMNLESSLVFHRRWNEWNGWNHPSKGIVGVSIERGTIHPFNPSIYPMNLESI